MKSMLGRLGTLLFMLIVCGCDDSKGGTSGSSGSGSGSAGSGQSGGAQSGSANCKAMGLLQSLDRDRLLVGASMNDDVAKAAPFDVRYLYLAGTLFDGNAACSSCATNCSSSGTSCSNASGGCGWWGCWQYDQVPPGAYVRDFIAKAKADGQLPMITYYTLLQASGAPEGATQIPVANDSNFMTRYFADWRFLLQQVAQERVLLHIEPDLWGYAEHVNADPSKIKAAVASVNADCADRPNTMAGFGQCLIAMTRKYAPKARVGLHASPWATKIDVLTNRDASLDVEAEAHKVADYLKASGGADADFIAVDASDRDAAWYDSQGQDRWWDDTNATLPNFTQAFRWAKALAERADRPLIWWQLPVGNMRLPNQNEQWKDNRLDYFFAHTDQVVASHGAIIAFGSGAGGQTNPSTDGGNLISKTKALKTQGGQAPCP